MEKVSYHNVLAVATGVSIIVLCCSISYFFQKHVFSKYREKVANTAGKKPRP